MKSLLFIIVIFFTVSVNANEAVSWNQVRASPVSKIVEYASSSKVSELKEYTEVYFDLKINIQNGHVKQSVTRIFYFPDSTSLQNFGTDSIRFNNDIEHLSIFRIATFSLDGKIKDFSRGDLKINDSNSRNTFSSLKEAVFAYPGLEPGNFGIVEFELTQDLSARETDWYKELYPTNFYSRLNFNLSVTWDDNFPMHISNIDKNVECKESKNSFSCIGKNIPKVKSDVNVLWSDQLASIQLGQLQSWDEVEKRSNKLFLKSQIPDNKTIETFVKDLLKGETDQQKKIWLIHNFVAQKIQYVSMSESGNSYTPHSILETFQKRRGDCKDKSALFYGMLKAAGVNVYPTLVATDRIKLESIRIPTMNIFDHMIVCYEYEKGKPGCSELTDSLIEAGKISGAAQGKIALQLQNGQGLFNLHAYKYKWSANYQTDLKFTKDGGQEEIQTRSYNGDYGLYWRRKIDGKSPEEIEGILHDDYKANVSNKATVNFDVKGKDVLGSELVIGSKAIYTPLINPAETLNYSDNDVWLLADLKDSKIPNKVYEYNFTGVAVGSTNVWDISNNWDVSIHSANLNLVHKYGKMIRNVEKVGVNKFRTTTTIEIPKRLVLPSEIDSFNHFIDMLINESSLYVYAKHH